METAQLLILPVTENPGREKRKKPSQRDSFLPLLFLLTYFDLKVKVREAQLLRQQAYNDELRVRLAVLQDENQYLQEDLKDARKTGTPPKKRIRVYNRQCVNCAATFESKSFDRNYCDSCRDIGEQRRKGFNRGKGKLK